jgi:hypothetical protein
MHVRRLLAIAGAIGFLAAPALAQSSRGVEGRLVVGVAFQGGVFGDDNPRGGGRVGLTVGAQVRWKPENRTGVALDIGFQPVALKNPHFDERLRVLTIHVAPEIGRTFYVRPGGGIAVHFWSGRSAETPISLAPSVGLSIGVHKTLSGQVRISPELISRASIEHGALAYMLGAQLPISWGSR